MDKATAEQLRAEIAALSPEQRLSLKALIDAIDAQVAASQKLDRLLAEVIKEKNEAKRLAIAEGIKKMMPGLLGEDCSVLVGPQ